MSIIPQSKLGRLYVGVVAVFAVLGASATLAGAVASRTFNLP